MVEHTDNGEKLTEKIYLNKTSTQYTIKNCKPDTLYKITMCYDAYFTTDGKLQDEPTSVAHDTVSVRTGSDLGYISIVSLLENKIEFQIKLQKNYPISSGKVVLYNSNGEKKLAEYVISENERKAAEDGNVTCRLEFDTSGVNTGDLLYLVFEDVFYDGEPFVISQKTSITYNK